MTSERWGEIKTVLAGVLETDPQERTATLDRLCHDDAELRREVEALLAYEEKAEALLNTVVSAGSGAARGSAAAAVDRAISRLARIGPRRHGRGLPGRTGGRAISQAGGHQADYQRAQRCPDGAAIPPGAPDPGAVGT
jgi:hypothetical protein